MRSSTTAQSEAQISALQLRHKSEAEQAQREFEERLKQVQVIAVHPTMLEIGCNTSLFEKKLEPAAPL